MNPSNYSPSSVLNAPSLQYAGSGQLLTPTFSAVASGTTLTIPASALSWSITGSGSANITINGVTTTTTGAISFSGLGPLFYPVLVNTISGNIYVSYELNNVVYNSPSSY